MGLCAPPSPGIFTRGRRTRMIRRISRSLLVTSLCHENRPCPGCQDFPFFLWCACLCAFQNGRERDGSVVRLGGFNEEKWVDC